MSAALIYKPAARWRFPVALACAALVHAAAVVAAGRFSGETLHDMRSDDDGSIVTVEPELPPPLPPADADDAAPPPSPPPVASDTFVEERIPPPPRARRLSAAPAPIVRRNAPGAGQPASASSARVLALSAPRPEYPYDARRQRLTGSGVAMLTIDFASGNVLDVQMVQSTGNAVLDNATVNGFRRWRFKPGTTAKVRTPITFTLAGASY